MIMKNNHGIVFSFSPLKYLFPIPSEFQL